MKSANCIFSTCCSWCRTHPEKSAVRPLPHRGVHGCMWLANVTGIDRKEVRSLSEFELWPLAPLWSLDVIRFHRTFPAKNTWKDHLKSTLFVISIRKPSRKWLPWACPTSCRTASLCLFKRAHLSLSTIIMQISKSWHLITNGLDNQYIVHFSQTSWRGVSVLCSFLIGPFNFWWLFL